MEEIIGYTNNFEPVYKKPKGSLVLNGFTLCQKCNAVISSYVTSADICIKCYEEIKDGK